MEKRFVLACVVCLAAEAWGAPAGNPVPAGFAYQGVLSDPVTGPLAGEQTVTFRLFDEVSGGVPLWETNQMVVCSPEGLFHAWLEGGEEMTDAFLESGDGPFGRYLELEVEGHGGAIAPRVEFTASPQALLAHSARQSVADFPVAGDLAVAATNGVSRVAATSRFGGKASFTNLHVGGNATWTGSAPSMKVDGPVEAGTLEVPGCLAAGSIAMWAGDPHSIPEGWALCDGSNGTPDLRDLFLVGVGDDRQGQVYRYGDVGGADAVALESSQIPAHHHGMDAPDEQQEYVVGNPSWGDEVLYALADALQETDPAGEGKAHENRPPYCALYFIMKL